MYFGLIFCLHYADIVILLDSYIITKLFFNNFILNQFYFFLSEERSLFSSTFSKFLRWRLHFLESKFFNMLTFLNISLNKMYNFFIKLSFLKLESPHCFFFNNNIKTFFISSFIHNSKIFDIIFVLKFLNYNYEFFWVDYNLGIFPKLKKSIEFNFTLTLYNFFLRQ